ncbi:MAG TPA: hypothetical protein VHZ81_12995 [Galbitalea sp.]|nr:hypothetical protein [Galbitalea sp.]
MTAVAALSFGIGGFALAPAGIAAATTKPVSVATGEASILTAFNSARDGQTTPTPPLTANGFVDEYAELAATAYAACNGCANPTFPREADVLPTALTSSFDFKDRRAGTIASTLNEFEANASLVGSLNSSALGDHYGSVALVLKGGYVYEFVYFAQADTIPGRIIAPTPAITGTAAVGRTLMANPGVVTPADTTIQFTWMRSDGVSVANFTNTYVPTADDLGKTLTVTELITKDGYKSLSLNTASTAKIKIGTIVPGKVTISGHANLSIDGKVTPEVLTAQAGTWSPGSASLAYQWYANGRAITGARADSFALPASGSIRGKRITVRVTGSQPGFTTAARLSAPTAPVGPPRVVFVTPVDVSGSPTIGGTLTASGGEVLISSTRATWEWTINGKVVPGATKSTFVVPPVAFSKPNSVIEAVSVGTGKDYATAYSISSSLTATQIFFTTNGGSTLDTTTPGHTLSVHVSGFDPAPTVIHYQWFRDGVAIPKATKSTLVTSTTNGHSYFVAMLVTRAGYFSNVLDSGMVAVNRVDFTDGTANVMGVTPGKTLSVQVAGFAPAPTSYTYQWYRDGVKIPRATARTLVTSKTDGYHYYVVVTASRANYNSATIQSNTATVSSEN